MCVDGPSFYNLELPQAISYKKLIAQGLVDGIHNLSLVFSSLKSIAQYLEANILCHMNINLSWSFPKMEHTTPVKQ